MHSHKNFLLINDTSYRLKYCFFLIERKLAVTKTTIDVFSFHLWEQKMSDTKYQHRNIILIWQANKTPLIFKANIAKLFLSAFFVFLVPWITWRCCALHDLVPVSQLILLWFWFDFQIILQKETNLKYVSKQERNDGEFSLFFIPCK